MGSITARLDVWTNVLLPNKEKLPSVFESPRSPASPLQSVLVGSSAVQDL